MGRRAPTFKPPRPAAPAHRATPPVNRQASRALHTGSAEWARQRYRVLLRDLYKCRDCGGFGNHVDHINGNAHEIVTDSELQTLCERCHSRKTATENGGYGNQRGGNG